MIRTFDRNIAANIRDANEKAVLIRRTFTTLFMNTEMSPA